MANIKINTEALKTGREWVRHKVQDGNNIFRILPPFGDAEVHKNYPFRRWVVAWLVDPKSGKRMPFATPFSSGEKDAACPVHEYTKALGDKVEKLKAALQAKGVSNDVIREKLGPLNKILWETRSNRTFAYNAVDKSGKIGLLELKKTAHDEMKKRMLEYIQERQMDPTSLNSDIKSDAGVWFNIKRSGMGKDTKYHVEFAKKGTKDADGDVVYKLDRSALPPEVVDGFDTQGYDLSTIYRLKNYEELKEILLYNIGLIAEETPAAVVAGFEPDASPVALVEEEIAEEEEVVAAAPKAAVGLALDEDDDDDILAEVEAAPAPVAKKAAAPKASKSDSLDDIMSMADDLLGD